MDAVENSTLSYMSTFVVVTEWILCFMSVCIDDFKTWQGRPWLRYTFYIKGYGGLSGSYMEEEFGYGMP